MEKRATIKDVAKKAGVTIGTVSHVLNGTASISRETTERVRQVVHELGYVPNASARNMRKKHNRMIGLLVPKISNYYYSQLSSVFMNEAAKDGYTVMLLSYEYSLDREKEEIRNLIENNVEAIVIVNGSRDEESIRDAIDKKLKIVLADRRTDLADVPYVEFENKVEIIKAVRLLKQKGYRSVGFLSESLDLSNLQDRYEGYKLALQENGYEYRADYVYISDEFRQDHLEQGYCFIKKLLSEKTEEELPEAFFISSDMMALGIIKGMEESGYRIPEDFGIISYDDLQVAAFSRPALTTIRQDRHILGRTLWDITRKKVMGMEVENIRLPQKLVVRESC